MPRKATEPGVERFPASAFEQVQPNGRGFNYAEGFKGLDLAALKKALAALNDGFPVLVARELRKRWPALHSHGVAQRRYLPFWR